MNKPSGFTLIELIIVVAIIAIIAAIAIPSYNESVRKGRRAEAARFVGDMQLSLERWRAENPSFANCGGTACATASGTYPVPPSAAASPFYEVAITGADAVSYTVTAARRAGTAQASDRCLNLVLTRSAASQGKPLWTNLACN